MEKTKSDLRKMDVNAHLRRVDPPGMAWCYMKQHFVPVSGFSKNRAKRRGLENECKNCKHEREQARKVVQARSDTVGCARL